MKQNWKPYDDQIRILKQNALSDRRDAERAGREQLKERDEAQLEQEQQFRY